MISDQQIHHIIDHLMNDGWIVACLCAAWCNTCRDYQTSFAQLQAKYAEDANVQFIWMDIEDNHAWLAEIDIEDFPTLLIQRGSTVVFFAPVTGNISIAERLFLAYYECTQEVLIKEAYSTPQRCVWQQAANLLSLLRKHTHHI